MLRKGIKGYILKTTMEPILLDAIRKVYSGEQYLEPFLKEKVMQDSLRAKKEISAKKTSIIFCKLLILNKIYSKSDL